MLLGGRMSGLSKVIVLDPDVRASRQIQLGFEREGVPAAVVQVPVDASKLDLGVEDRDPSLVMVGGSAETRALDLIRRTKRLLDEAHIDAPIVFAGRGVRRTEAEAAGADEVVLQPAHLRDVVTVGRLLRGTQAHQRRHIVGNLAETTGVFTLVRALSRLGRSAVLTLIRGLRRGEVRFYHGEVTSAQVGLIHGQAALHQLLLWTDARFDFRHEDVVRRQQIPLSHDELFADADRFLATVRASAGALSPSMVLEQDIPRIHSLGNQIPTEVHGVLRMFDGHRVLADVLEDSPYRVFETLRVAQRAIDVGLLRQATAPRPKATWRAVLSIEEWLVGADRNRPERPPSESGPMKSVDPSGPHLKGSRRKRKKRRGNTPLTTPVIQTKPEIDWGALVPRTVGAEVGPLAGVVPAAHASGEIELPASREEPREKLEALMDTDKREKIFPRDIGLEPKVVWDEYETVEREKREAEEREAVAEEARQRTRRDSAERLKREAAAAEKLFADGEAERLRNDAQAKVRDLVDRQNRDSAQRLDHPSAGAVADAGGADELAKRLSAGRGSGEIAALDRARIEADARASAEVAALAEAEAAAAAKAREDWARAEADTKQRAVEDAAVAERVQAEAAAVLARAEAAAAVAKAEADAVAEARARADAEEWARTELEAKAREAAQRIEEEGVAAKRADEERVAAEARKRAEDERVADEAKRADEARVAEAKRAEEARAADARADAERAAKHRAVAEAKQRAEEDAKQAAMVEAKLRADAVARDEVERKARLAAEAKLAADKAEAELRAAHEQARVVVPMRGQGPGVDSKRNRAAKREAKRRDALEARAIAQARADAEARVIEAAKQAAPAPRPARSPAEPPDDRPELASVGDDDRTQPRERVEIDSVHDETTQPRILVSPPTSDAASDLVRQLVADGNPERASETASVVVAETPSTMVLVADRLTVTTTDHTARLVAEPITTITESAPDAAAARLVAKPINEPARAHTRAVHDRHAAAAEAARADAAADAAAARLVATAGASADTTTADRASAARLVATPKPAPALARPVEAAPVEMHDEPSDGVIREHLDSRNEQPPPPPPEHHLVDDRPEDATGEITTPISREELEAEHEPSILVSDLVAVHSSISAIATAQVAAPPTPNAATVSKEHAVATVRGDAQHAFDEIEEAFFRAGNDPGHPVQPPKGDSFDDLDEGYQPVGFWDRLLGRRVEKPAPKAPPQGPQKPKPKPKPKPRRR